MTSVKSAVSIASRGWPNRWRCEPSMLHQHPSRLIGCGSSSLRYCSAVARPEPGTSSWPEAHGKAPADEVSVEIRRIRNRRHCGRSQARQHDEEAAEDDGGESGRRAPSVLIPRMQVLFQCIVAEEPALARLLRD